MTVMVTINSKSDDGISEWIIFEVGYTRFAIKRTAEIEQLLPAGPIAVEQKQPKSDRSRRIRRTLFCGQRMTFGPRTILSPDRQQDADATRHAFFPSELLP
jgi:hypothetical protein